MIHQDRITLTLPRRTIQRIDSLSAKKRLSRAELVTELVDEYARRDQVRSRVQEIAQSKKQNRARLRAALENLPDSKLSEAELNREIEAAIKQVRKTNRN